MPLACEPQACSAAFDWYSGDYLRSSPAALSCFELSLLDSASLACSAPLRYSSYSAQAATEYATGPFSLDFSRCCRRWRRRCARRRRGWAWPIELPGRCSCFSVGCARSDQFEYLCTKLRFGCPRRHQLRQTRPPVSGSGAQYCCSLWLRS